MGEQFTNSRFDQIRLLLPNLKLNVKSAQPIIYRESVCFVASFSFTDSFLQDILKILICYCDKIRVFIEF